MVYKCFVFTGNAPPALLQFYTYTCYFLATTTIRKHGMLTRCCCNVGPSSTTMTQRCINIGSMSCVCLRKYCTLYISNQPQGRVNCHIFVYHGSKHGMLNQCWFNVCDAGPTSHHSAYQIPTFKIWVIYLHVLPYYNSGHMTENGYFVEDSLVFVVIHLLDQSDAYDIS